MRMSRPNEVFFLAASFPLLATTTFSARDDPRGFSIKREHGGVYRYPAEIRGVGKVEDDHPYLSSWCQCSIM